MQVTHRMAACGLCVIKDQVLLVQVAHQHIWVFYQVCILEGALRQEINSDDTIDPWWWWWWIGAVQRLSRSSLVDVGVTMWRDRPATGHVDPVPVRGPIRH